MSTGSRTPGSAPDSSEDAARIADSECALQELRDLARVARTAGPEAALRATTIDVCIGTRQERLELLLLPSIFAPEDWAFTFLEGLFRVPLEEYADRELVELGTGSGWICIALAKFTELARIWGVDLNPHAVPLAICNAFLNGVPGIGERVVFGESDLLEQLPVGRRFDFVIGCIPQVLRANASPVTGEDERSLYDLSNYCSIQNVYEDHFGLGLIARLLDEVPERLASSGRLLLNLAGRPGHAIIERMFSRRGFRTELTFARRVKQASDTDIAPLVQLESQTGREFEFYLDAHSAKPISAATAAGWLAAGNPIWHEVAVWSARPVLLRETLRLRHELHALGAARILQEIDLSAVSIEQLEFVSALCSLLRTRPTLPYPALAGDPSLREEIARYLQRFFDLRLRANEIFIAPEREQAVHSLALSICDPGDRVLITHNIQETYTRALHKASVSTVVSNTTLHEIGQLLATFDVRAALIAVEPDERSNLAELRSILELAAQRGIWVIIDESAAFNITSGVETRTLFEFLARERGYPNLIVLYGLIKNAVFPDFELTLMLPVPNELGRALGHAAELTYSRIALLPQLFYEQLFTSLLSFRVSFSQPGAMPESPTTSSALPCSRRVRDWSEAPALREPCFDPEDPQLVRLDYGENETRVPSLLIEGLIAGCIRVDHDDAELALAHAVTAFLLETRGVRYSPDQIVLGAGVWPLVRDLTLSLSEACGRPARILVLAPCYGMLPPTLRAAGAEVELAAHDDWLECAQRFAPDAIALCQPQNPGGTYHTRESLLELAAYVVAHGCWLISDEIFGLLNLSDVHAETVPSPLGLESATPRLIDHSVVLGGLSKEFAAGGLRVGWLAMRDAAWAARVRELALCRVHEASARAATHLYSAYARHPSGKRMHPERHREVRAYLIELRRELARKRAALLRIFPEVEDPSYGASGGLFLAPRVDRWFGTEVDGVRLDAENFARTLYQHTHVVVNDGAWCGDTRRVRTVFALPDALLLPALERLERFVATYLDKRPESEADTGRPGALQSDDGASGERPESGPRGLTERQRGR